MDCSPVYLPGNPRLCDTVETAQPCHVMCVIARSHAFPYAQMDANETSGELLYRHSIQTNRHGACHLIRDQPDMFWQQTHGMVIFFWQRGPLETPLLRAPERLQEGVQGKNSISLIHKECHGSLPDGSSVWRVWAAAANPH